ncbi:hypothetical protein BKA82DRAFT_4341423 [Pisolithus tinctorius]|nr:hypothetical protein BKA82DRAFT_4341423 [Pisolithus tinctorius]
MASLLTWGHSLPSTAATVVVVALGGGSGHGVTVWSKSDLFKYSLENSYYELERSGFMEKQVRSLKTCSWIEQEYQCYCQRVVDEEVYTTPQYSWLSGHAVCFRQMNVNTAGKGPVASVINQAQNLPTTKNCGDDKTS